MKRPEGWGVRPPGFFDPVDPAEEENLEEIVSEFGGEENVAIADNPGLMAGNLTSLGWLEAFPEGLDYNEAREQWEMWKDLFSRTLELRPDIKSQRLKETLMISRGGTTIRNIAANQDPAPDEVKAVGQGEELPVFENLVKRCDYYFKNTSNVAIDMQRFHSIVQRETETFEAFVMRLRRAARTCSYSDVAIKVQILKGAKDKDVLAQYGIMADKPLGELIAYGMRLEMVKAETVKEEKAETISALNERRRFESNDRGWQGSRRWGPGEGRYQAGQHQNAPSWRNGKHGWNHKEPHKNEQSNIRDRSPFPSGQPRCNRCARVHAQGQCPASDKKCRKCDKYGHFEVVCHGRGRERINQLDMESPSAVKVKEDGNEWDY